MRGEERRGERSEEGGEEREVRVRRGSDNMERSIVAPSDMFYVTLYL